MDERTKTEFLRKRMMELREKNHKTLSEMATLIGVSKSALSRAEKIGGSTSFKTVHGFAEDYCNHLGLSDKQKQLFLRGEKAVVVDTSALLKRPDLLYELSEEYSCVFVPSFVIDELRSIKNNNTENYAYTALSILDFINDSNGLIQTKNMDIQTHTDLMILDIARTIAEEMSCEVDIVTYDVPLAIHIKRCIRSEEDPPYHLLFLEEYASTKQNLINMSVLYSLNDYYADSYDDVEQVLGIEIPSGDDLNAYLADGITLLISAVDKTEIPISQRLEKIKWLIKHGANVDKRDCRRYNFPPITHAIKNHEYEMFLFLLVECKANPNVASRNPYDIGKIRHKNDGNTPLMVAAWENQVEMVKDLCNDKRISLNQQDTNGFTALIKACYRGNLECRDIIQAAGADKTILDLDGYTAEDRYDEFLRIGRPGV